MRRSFYFFNPGRLSRRDDTLKLTPVDKGGQTGTPRFLPIETVESLYVFGNLDANSAALNFLGKKHVPVHFFDYYEHYTGSFQPKDYLLAGKMQIEQTRAYLTKKKRLHLARAFVAGSAHNLLRNLRYYANRGRETGGHVEQICQYKSLVAQTTAIDELMGTEGNCRMAYYDAWDAILRDGWSMNGRSRRPPGNEVNALVSFGNSLCYAACLDQLFHTQLNPTISFLHEPGFRRYSLALDLAEIFKPVLVDRLIFRMLNKLELQKKHFEYVGGGCFLKESGRKVFVRAWDERLNQTLTVKGLSKPVSYKRLIRLDAYKVQNIFSVSRLFTVLIKLISMYVIAVYDVRADRTSKLLRLCRRYLTWIQNSVFEGEISAVRLKELKIEAKKLMTEKDSFIIFTSREARWLEKTVIGHERNSTDNIF